jgi:hypothetical protein
MYDLQLHRHQQETSQRYNAVMPSVQVRHVQHELRNHRKACPLAFLNFAAACNLVNTPQLAALRQRSTFPVQARIACSHP